MSKKHERIVEERIVERSTCFELSNSIVELKTLQERNCQKTIGEESKQEKSRQKTLVKAASGNQFDLEHHLQNMKTNGQYSWSHSRVRNVTDTTTFLC